MITLSNVSKQYAGKYLLRTISLRVGDRERLAVVGANGAGKSTLMKIILGVVEPDAGEIQRSRSHSAGYLPQDGVTHRGRSLAAEAATAFDDLLELHTRAEGIHGEIAALAAAERGESPELQELVSELGRIQHQLEHREGWSIESKVREVLFGLGFGEQDMERATEEFSGGWQMRLALAKLLLREPAVLMLDEPTNHLDLESLRWLEEYLRTFAGSVVLVSHDRRFLDTLVERTIELSRGRATEYKGNYSFYLREKEIRTQLLRAQYENQQEKIKSTMEFVDRFRAKNTKARQVQSRLRMLERMELVELEDEEGSITFDFPSPPRPGRVVMRLEGLHKNYGDREVFAGLDLTLERGDRLSLLGVNGSGKSTLARIIAGIEPFQSGIRTPGHNVSISYYAQHQAEELDAGKTVLQTLEETAPPGMQRRLRTLLGCFLFTGDDVFKKVGVLSGGEKSRLALAKILLLPANLIILDEPTNHLDMRSKTVLQSALRRFTGTCVLVSHDRDFVEPLATRIADLGSGRFRLFPGGLKEYLARTETDRDSDPGREAGGRRRAGATTMKTPSQLERERKRAEAVRRQRYYRSVRPLQEALAGIEEKIGQGEERKRDIETDLSSDRTCRDSRRAGELSAEYREVTTNLAYLYDEWARLQEEIEGLDLSEGGTAGMQ